MRPLRGLHLLVVCVTAQREDWERDGRTRFHWTTLQSSVRLPLHLSGPGHRLRMRIRRHFVEPARVILTAEGRTVAVFEAVADTKVPYRTMQFDLPDLQGRHPLVLGIQSSSVNPRPLGIAIVGGLIVSQLLTLYTTPVIYLAFDRLARRFRRDPA